ncbi:MAG: hypothetical protein AAF368_01495 [Planctomycetota bacterium]
MAARAVGFLMGRFELEAGCRVLGSGDLDRLFREEEVMGEMADGTALATRRPVLKSDSLDEGRRMRRVMAARALPSRGPGGGREGDGFEGVRVALRMAFAAADLFVTAQ